MYKLDLGCGNQPRGEDYICIDRYVTGNIVWVENGVLVTRRAPEYKWLQADILNLPFADNSVDEIWCSHVLEHIQMSLINAALKEWFRVLKPVSKIILQVPNFDYVARYWLTGPDRNWAEAMIFGTQDNKGDFHKSAFTAQNVKADLEAAGFEVKRVEYKWNHSQETLQAIGVKC